VTPAHPSLGVDLHHIRNLVFEGKNLVLMPRQPARLVGAQNSLGRQLLSTTAEKPSVSFKIGREAHQARETLKPWSGG